MIADLVSQILSNPDGGTIRMDGRPLPRTGYFVGGAGRALSFELTDSAFARDLIRDYLNGITFDRAMYVGWWTDAETGKLWLDTTTWTGSYNQAEQWCTDRGEIAFWDIERAREFRPIVKAQPSA